MKCFLFISVFAIALTTSCSFEDSSIVGLYKDIEKEFKDGLPKGREQIINEFTDMVIHELKEMMIDYGLDPMKLPDINKKISYKPIIITYWGSLNLTNGWMQGASTLARKGNVAVDYSKRILKVDVPITLDDLIFDYRYKVRIMGLGPNGGVDGKATKVSMNIKLEIDLENATVALRDFSHKMGKISVKFNGHILVDWLVNIMSGVITTLFKGIVVNMTENIMKDGIVQILDQVNELLAEVRPK